jgi:cytochrome c
MSEIDLRVDHHVNPAADVYGRIMQLPQTKWPLMSERNKSASAAVLSLNRPEDNPMKRNTRIINDLLVGAFLAATSIAAATQALADTTPNGDVVHGKALYQGCQACHSIDDNDLGPMHRGVVGRRAGSVEAYSYSAALKNSGLTWDEATLDRWLSSPSALVPGTKMFFKIDDAQARADIIAYLKELN